MNLYEIAYLSDEQVQMFTSDFRIVADYFVQMRKNRNYIAPETTINHVHELLQLMSVMTRDITVLRTCIVRIWKGDQRICVKY